jgi:CheY-like chemotaxis protein
MSERFRLTPPGSQPDERHLRVMIVDDNDDGASAMADLVRIWGFNAKTAKNGADALRLYAEYRPSVVLLDLVLPDRNGYDLALQLRERAWRRRLLIVVTTGFAPLTDSEAGRFAGIFHHLLKPVDPATLKQILMAEALELPEATGAADVSD